MHALRCSYLLTKKKVVLVQTGTCLSAQVQNCKSFLWYWTSLYLALYLLLSETLVRASTLGHGSGSRVVGEEMVASPSAGNGG
jgi:hypothetical protein